MRKELAARIALDYAKMGAQERAKFERLLAELVSVHLSDKAIPAPDLPVQRIGRALRSDAEV